MVYGVCQKVVPAYLQHAKQYLSNILSCYICVCTLRRLMQHSLFCDSITYVTRVTNVTCLYISRRISIFYVFGNHHSYSHVYTINLDAFKRSTNSLILFNWLRGNSLILNIVSALFSQTNSSK